jgi:serine/threonine-protein kinase RsbW
MMATVSRDPSRPPAAAWHVFLEVPSSIDMLTLVDHVTESFGRVAGLDDDGTYKLGIAVREAVINGIKHGNRGDVEKRVRLDYKLVDDDGPRRAVVRIRDQGTGFDPEAGANALEPDHETIEHGRGLLIMRGVMDDVQVRCTPAEGTEVMLVKAINPPGSVGS